MGTIYHLKGTEAFYFGGEQRKVPGYDQYHVLALELLVGPLGIFSLNKMNAQMKPNSPSNSTFLARNRLFIHLLSKVFAIVLTFQLGANALFLNEPITALRVPNNSIVIDGRPDAIWKALAARYSFNTLSFSTYSKIVLLQSDAIRNAPPANYYTAPSLGSITMVAAYDDFALYFYFLVQENTAFNPSTLCTATNLWKANAPEVYIDPSPWDENNYRAYFSLDGTGLVFGTSPKTVQLDKPIYPTDTRFFFRNRKTAPDKFQIPASLPSGVLAMASVHSKNDSLLVGVEMKIPYWTGNAIDFEPGKSMFISWGYNHYPNAGKANCDSTPIAYRWAKHYLTYTAGDANKPVGWRAGDSTHFDPTRSWDGWGRFDLYSGNVYTGGCTFTDTATWDLRKWSVMCASTTALLSQEKKASTKKERPSVKPFLFQNVLRDARGRVLNYPIRFDYGKAPSP